MSDPKPGWIIAYEPRMDDVRAWPCRDVEQARKQIGRGILDVCDDALCAQLTSNYPDRLPADMKGGVPLMFADGSWRIATEEEAAW